MKHQYFFGLYLPDYPEATPRYLFLVAMLLAFLPFFPESYVQRDLDSRGGERTFCAMGTTGAETQMSD